MTDVNFPRIVFASLCDKQVPLEGSSRLTLVNPGTAATVEARAKEAATVRTLISA